jgi:hypothetical protein
MVPVPPNCKELRGSYSAGAFGATVTRRTDHDPPLVQCRGCWAALGDPLRGDS